MENTSKQEKWANIETPGQKPNHAIAIGTTQAGLIVCHSLCLSALVVSDINLRKGIGALGWNYLL